VNALKTEAGEIRSSLLLPLLSVKNTPVIAENRSTQAFEIKENMPE
jgi:hypothetical protein